MGRVRRRLNNILIHLHNYTAGRYRDGGILYCCWGRSGFGGLSGVESGGRLTYPRSVRVVLPVIATAIAFAPSSPILLSERLKRAGKGLKMVEQRINTFA